MNYRDFRNLNSTEIIYKIRYKSSLKEELLFESVVNDLKIKDIVILNRYYVTEEPNYNGSTTFIKNTDDCFLSIPCKVYDFNSRLVRNKAIDCYYSSYKQAKIRLPKKVRDNRDDDNYMVPEIRSQPIDTFLSFNNKEIY